MESPDHATPRPAAARKLRDGARPPEALRAAQTFGALLFGILLFAVPLYLWRRPRAAPAVQPDAGAPDAGPVSAASAAPAADASPPPAVRLAEPRVLECHDPGSRRTPPDQCDHVAGFEKALGDAIEASHDCVPPDAGAGSIQFVADLSFARRRHPVIVSLPRDGRTFQSTKIVKACAAGVRGRLGSLPLGALTHAHGRYKVSVVASYGAP